MIYMELYRIKDLREDNDQKQSEISRLLNISEGQYRRYEQQKNIVPLDRAVILARHYNVSLDYIARLSNDKGGLHCNNLTDQEREMIENWRRLSERQRQRIMEEITDYIS